MKNITYYFSLLIIPLILSCNTDDDNSPEPEPEPIVANAKIVSEGDCWADENLVELYELDENVIPEGERNHPLYQVLNIPQEFWIDDLEIYIEYIPVPENERRFCVDFGYQSYELKATLVQLPTTTD